MKMNRNKQILDDEEIRQRIVAAAHRHPQSRAAKLMLEFEEKPHVVTLVLLIEEISNHAVYNIDYDIPVRYYLTRLEEFMNASEENITLNESSKVLEHSSKIYGRRIENLFDRVNQLVSNLVQSDKELQASKNNDTDENATADAVAVADGDADDAATPAEKPKRPRKRQDDLIVDNYEAHLEVKKFKTIAEDKLYAEPKEQWEPKNSHAYMDEDHINVALWRHAHVIDAHNIEDKDPMRNYKMFTYVFDHRYYMPVADTNYRLLFDVRDFLEAENINMDYDIESSEDEDNNCDIEDMDATECAGDVATRKKRKINRHQEYMQRTLSLEDQFFRQRLVALTGEVRDETTTTSRKRPSSTLPDCVNKLPRLDFNDSSKETSQTENANNLIQDISQPTDSALGDSDFQEIQSGIISSTVMLEQSLEQSQTNEVQQQHSQDSGLGSSLQQLSTQVSTADSAFCESTNNNSNLATQPTIDNDQSNSFDNHEDIFDDNNAGNILESTRLEHNIATPNQVNGSEKQKVDLDDFYQHVDEGVVLTDEENNTRLSPVVCTDGIATNNEDDDDDDENEEIFMVTAEVQQPVVPIVKNIFQIDEKILRKKVLFKLGLDYKLFMLQRCLKRPRGGKDNVEHKRYKSIRHFNDDEETNKILGSSSPTSERDEFEYYGGFLGFDQRCDSGMDDFEPNANYYSSESKLNRWLQDVAADRGIDLSADSNYKIDGCTQTNVDEIDADGNISVRNLPNLGLVNIDDLDDDLVNESIMETDTAGQENEQQSVDCDTNKLTNTNTDKDKISTDTESLTVDKVGTEANINEPQLNETPTVDLESAAVNMETSVIDSDDEDLDTDETRQKIRDWHRQIGPSLAAAHSRQHFSVYDIGTEIINKVAASETQHLSLQDLMHDKDPTHLSRVFLSLLMLTNQNNVELDPGKRCVDKPTDLCDVKVKLKSLQRHEVHFEDDIGAVQQKQQQPKQHKKPVQSTTKNDSQKTTTKPATVATEVTTTTAAATATTTIITEKEVKKSKQKLNVATAHINIDKVHVLKPIPKALNATDDNDSGISSLGSSYLCSSINSSR